MSTVEYSTWPDMLCSGFPSDVNVCIIDVHCLQWCKGVMASLLIVYSNNDKEFMITVNFSILYTCSIDIFSYYVYVLAESLIQCSPWRNVVHICKQLLWEVPNSSRTMATKADGIWSVGGTANGKRNWFCVFVQCGAQDSAMCNCCSHC